MNYVNHDIDKGASAAAWPPCDQDEADAPIWYVEWSGRVDGDVVHAESDPMTWTEATDYADAIFTSDADPDSVEYAIHRITD